MNDATRRRRLRLALAASGRRLNRIALPVALLSFLLGPPLLAQDPPLAGRPAQFSDIVGTYTIQAAAAPTTVPVEEPIALRVTIAGNGPAKYRPERQRLKLFPESWARDFYIEAVPAADRVVPEAGSWEFVYRLRPRRQGITAIDGIKLVSYRPPAGNRPGRYQTAYAEPIAITVTPRPAGPAVPDDLPVRTAPASFYELPDAAAVRAPWPTPAAPPAWLLVAALVGPPLLAILGVIGWRGRFARSRRRPRSLAARRARQALAGAEPVWTVLAGYLRERFDWPIAEPTPAEVRQRLRRHGVARPIAGQAAALLEACDAARFAQPSAGDAAALRHDAERLIQALEDELCRP